MVGLSPVRTDTPLFLERPSAGQNFTLGFAFACHVLTRTLLDDPPGTECKEFSLEWFDGLHLQPSVQETQHSSYPDLSLRRQRGVGWGRVVL